MTRTSPHRRRAAAVAAALAFAATATAVVAAPHAPSVDEIIRRHLRARGGREQLRSIRTISVAGRMITATSEGAFTLTWMRPDKARLELVLVGRPVVETVSGDLGWWLRPDTRPPMRGLLPFDTARELAERADVEGMLATGRERGYAISVAGVEELDGDRVVTLLLTRGEGEVHRLSLSLRSYLVVRKVSKRGYPGTGVEVETRFSDYRAEGGVMIPHAVERRAGGELLHRIVVERVQLNPPVDPALFDPPSDLGGKAEQR